MSIRLLCGAVLGAFLLTASPMTTCAFAATDQPTQSRAQEDDGLEQKALTARQIDALLAAQDAISAIIDKIPEEERDEPNPQVEATLDKASQAVGFKDYEEFDAVASNVKFLLEGFDPKTKQFIGHLAVIKAEIAEIGADSQMRPRAKAKRLAELKEMMSEIPAVRFPASIALVAKSYDQLKDMFDEDE